MVSTSSLINRDPHIRLPESPERRQFRQVGLCGVIGVLSPRLWKDGEIAQFDAFGFHWIAFRWANSKVNEIPRSSTLQICHRMMCRNDSRERRCEQYSNVGAKILGYRSGHAGPSFAEPRAADRADAMTLDRTCIIAEIPVARVNTQPHASSHIRHFRNHHDFLKKDE